MVAFNIWVVNMSLYYKGFTLIVGLLAVLFFPMLLCGCQKISRIGSAFNQMSSIEITLDTYRLDMFKYPSSLEALVKNTTNSPKWQGPYLKKGIPKDPWGNEYQYKNPGREGRNYDLYAFGADGKKGGEKENADIFISKD